MSDDLIITFKVTLFDQKDLSKDRRAKLLAVAIKDAIIERIQDFDYPLCACEVTGEIG